MTSPNEAQQQTYSHINGSSTEELLDRFAVSEICRGWPVYRDASEWNNYRSLFTKDGAYVWTSKSLRVMSALKCLTCSKTAWSGPKTIDEFIEVSKLGKANGNFIMHRVSDTHSRLLLLCCLHSHQECGTLVDLNPETQRAVGKMKATITQRFTTPEGQVFDVDCDCRFWFFCLKESNKTASSALASLLGAPGTEWKTKFVKLTYDKDKLVSVDGTFPDVSSEELAKYPVGYRHLGWAQNKFCGHAIDLNLPTNDQYADLMYEALHAWLAGAENPGLDWE